MFRSLRYSGNSLFHRWNNNATPTINNHDLCTQIFVRSHSRLKRKDSYCRKILADQKLYNQFVDLALRSPEIHSQRDFPVLMKKYLNECIVEQLKAGESIDNIPTLQNAINSLVQTMIYKFQTDKVENKISMQSNQNPKSSGDQGNQTGSSAAAGSGKDDKDDKDDKNKSKLESESETAPEPERIKLSEKQISAEAEEALKRKPLSGRLGIERKRPSIKTVAYIAVVLAVVMTYFILSRIHMFGLGKLLADIDKKYFNYFNPTLKIKHELLLPNPTPHYTIVLDPRSLVHSEHEEDAFISRPYMDLFMDLLGHSCEIVMWTGSENPVELEIVEQLNFTTPVVHALFSHTECTYQFGILHKDLTRLNRDLKNVIHICSSPEHALLQPKNALFLQKWNGSPHDTKLLDLFVFLEKDILSKDPKTTDVRQILKDYISKDAAESHHEEQVEKHQQLVAKYTLFKLSANQLRLTQVTVD